MFITYSYFLGLRNLTVIDDTVKMIKAEDPDFNIDKIDLQDKATMKMMSQGLTDGVFQFESGGMRSVLQSFKPEKIEDLIAIISLYRPGPMDSIPKYIKNRHNPSAIKYKTELLRPILEVTYGCVVYQEQVMQIFRELAGYSLGRADIVRRAMSKKKHDVMEKERHAFIYGDKNPDGTVSCEGCVSRGISPSVAESIFDEMTAFSSYAFNKSHAAAYAYVAYQTAYLKCHYEKQYMSALLTSVLDDGVKLSKYIAECQKNGVRVLPPDVNRSNRGFTATNEGIRFGLLAVRNIGINLVEKLIAEREKGEFTSVYDFCTRLYGNDLNRRAAESLIKCGAFDCFGNTRRQLLQGIEPLMKAVEGVKRYSAGGQMGLFDTAEETVVDIGYTLPEVDEMPQFELLQGEKEVTGMYISGHPLYEYSAAMSEKGLVKTFDLLDSETNHKLDGKFVSIVAMASKLRRKQTKSNDTMAFLEVEDMYGSLNVLVFPKLYAEYQHLMTAGAVLKITGRVSVKESGEVDLVCSKIETVKKGMAEVTKPKVKKGLYLRVSSLDSEEYKLARQMLDIFKGSTPVIVKVDDIGKALAAHESRWISAEASLLRDLEEILGKDNVKYVE